MTPCTAFSKLEVGASGLALDGQSVAAPQGSKLGSGAPLAGPFYERIKSCAPTSRETPPRSYRVSIAGAVAYDQAAVAVETAAFGGFGLPMFEAPSGDLALRVLPVGAKGMQLSIMDEVAQSSDNADPAGPPAADPEAAFGEVRRPVQVVLLRIDGKRVEAVWADQLADDPIVKRIVVDGTKPDAVAAQFKQACRSASLTCDRVLIESDHAVSFERVEQVIGAFAGARSKHDPLKVEFVLLDPGSSAAERAAARLGVSLDSGKISQDAVESTIRTNYGRINGCYKSGLARDPAMHGRVVVRFRVDMQGNTDDVANAGDAAEVPNAQKTLPPITDASVVECILDVFKSLKFPTPQGGSVKIFYPLAFTPK